MICSFANFFSYVEGLLVDAAEQGICNEAH